MSKKKDSLFLSLVIAKLVENPAKYKKSDVLQTISKLDKCYNLDNDPRSDQYQQRRRELFQASTEYEIRHLVSKYLPEREQFVNRSQFCFLFQPQ